MHLRLKQIKLFQIHFLAFLTFSINDPERFIFNFEDYLKFNDISTQNLNFNF